MYVNLVLTLKMFPWFTMGYQIISAVVNDGSAWGMKMNDGRY